MKLFVIVMVSASMLAACGGATEEPAAEAEPVAAAPAEPAMTHPEIMQEIAQTRQTFEASVESADGAAAAEAASRLQELFEAAIPVYESRGLDQAVTIANGAAMAAAQAATAAQAGDFEAALAAHANVTVCGSCHSVFREKTPDGAGYQFKVME